MHGQLESAKTALLMLRGADDDAIEDEMHALEGAQGADNHSVFTQHTRVHMHITILRVL